MAKFLLRAVLVLVFLCFLLCCPAQGEEEISLIVNRGSVTETVYFTGLIKDNVTYAHLRQISEIAEFPIIWCKDTSSVVWQTGQGCLILTQDLEIVYLVGNEVKEFNWPVAPIMREGKFFVPLRMTELAGVLVEYDPATKTRSLNIPEGYSSEQIFFPYEAYLLVQGKLMEELAKRPQKISSFSTIFNSGYRSRTTNLKLAAEILDGYKIEPGESFSFNGTVGPRRPERGFEKAIVFINKKQVEDYGGGVCQVSSTLYNAVLKAGLPILERHPHSLPVAYVPKGKDATVSYGAADFRFKNNTRYPIIIRTSVDKNTLTLELFKERAEIITYEMSQ